MGAACKRHEALLAARIGGGAMHFVGKDLCLPFPFDGTSAHQMTSIVQYREGWAINVKGSKGNGRKVGAVSIADMTPCLLREG